MAAQTVPEPKYLQHQRTETDSASSAEHMIFMKHPIHSAVETGKKIFTNVFKKIISKYNKKNHKDLNQKNLNNKITLWMNKIKIYINTYNIKAGVRQL